MNQKHRLESVLDYHERTKHRFDRYARSPGYLDWSIQPVPFRFYEGAERIPLDVAPASSGPPYDAIFRPGAIEPALPARASVSRLLHDSLALSAWKRQGGARWSLRVNPSSGNLHPTEGYLLSGPVPGLLDEAVLAHYAPAHHALEVRARLSQVPSGSLLFGLTSIHWREAWKYGERAFRYCHLDAGHAIAAVSLSAAVLGWRARLRSSLTDARLAALLGIAEQSGAEAEHPDCVLEIRTDGGEPGRAPVPPPSSGPELAGRPNRLSERHHPWPLIDQVAEACRLEHPAPAGGDEEFFDALPGGSETGGELPARRIIRRRRSAVAMDGESRIDAARFFSMLARTLPARGRPPFAALDWSPAVHLVLFVHRVEGLEPGLYLLARRPDAVAGLREALDPGFEWSRPPGVAEGLPLYRLLPGDCRAQARKTSCHQEIASDGTFAVAMIAEFEPRLREHGAWFYKRLHWEAGAVGQVLYLEAEAAALRGTGIGCFFDDALHELLGLSGRDYQDVYHFTVGGAVEDPRVQTLEPYADRSDQ